jgi:hypothetical protein
MSLYLQSLIFIACLVVGFLLTIPLYKGGSYE